MDSIMMERISSTLTPERFSLLKKVMDTATARGLPLYIVGGFVRDLLLDRAPADFDLVVEGDAIALANALAKKYGGKITAHSKFGTAQWFLPQTLLVTHYSSLDLVSARSETYKHPAALPTVCLGNMTDDLRRRDFTINTLALRLDGDHFGELRDDLNGQADLQRRIVRVLHPGSFIDDPTRIFRAVRYEQRLGFKIDEETLALIQDALPLIHNLSPERVRHELDLILEEENTALMLQRLAELNILKVVHPALRWNRSIQKRFEKIRGGESVSRLALAWMAWLVNYSVNEIEQMDDRLHFKATLRQAIAAASALYQELDSLSGKKPSQVVARLEHVPLSALSAVELFAAHGEARKNLENYINIWRHVKPHTTGHTLKKLGLEPGPAYQSILLRLKNAWLDGEISSEQEEQALLDQLR
jgi:tRNA nucleotidyltransferase (CCA-adding enzyme)